jgi:drug/metabolite transporter (DMT)-like permease
MALGAFWFSIMGMLVKLGGRRLPSQELVLVRAVITLALSWWAMHRARLPVRGRYPVALLLRGGLGCAGLTCFYWSLLHLPLAEATLVQYSNPIWVTLMAALLLGEHVGAREAACLVVSLVGVALVVRGPALATGGAAAGAAAIPTSAALIALLGSMCSAGAYVAIRRMGTDEDPQRVTLYLPLVTVPVTLPFALRGWVWPTAAEWVVLLGMGIATQLAQVCLTRGLQRERAARATAVGYLQVVFAAAWGWLVFGERPGVWSAVGAGTIVASTLWMASAPRVAAARGAAARREVEPAMAAVDPASVE